MLQSFPGHIRETPLLILVYAVCLVCVLGFIYYMHTRFALASDSPAVDNYSKQRWDEFYSLPKNTLDMVFLGSSHSYCTFDPLTIDAQLGTNSFQLGMPLQHMDASYFTLKEVLNYHHIRYAVLEVYWDMLDDPVQPDDIELMAQVLQNRSLLMQYAREVYPLVRDKASKSAETAQISAVQMVQGSKEYYSGKGYVYCDATIVPSELNETNQFRGMNGQNWAIDKTELLYLNKIIQLCRENNIRLTLVTAPIAAISLDFIENYDIIHDVIQEIADRNNLQYLDYNIFSKQLLLLQNFRDDAHLNHSGVVVADDYFVHWYRDAYSDGPVSH